MAGIAVSKDGVPLGYVQLAIHPMKDQHGIHTLQPGEAYIEQIGVAAAARSKGIGKQLLQWAEERAREKHCTTLTLGVLFGNPAIHLYERFGFRQKPVDACEEWIVSPILVCFLMGRPYGLCDPHCGGVDMVKPLNAE